MKKVLKAVVVSSLLVGGLFAKSLPHDEKINMSNKKTIGLERLYYMSVKPTDKKKKIRHTPLLVDAFNLMTNPTKYVALDRSGNKDPLPNKARAKKIPDFDLVLQKLLLSVKNEKNEASAFYALYFMNELGFGTKEQKKNIIPSLTKALVKKQNCYAYTVKYAKEGIPTEKKMKELMQECPQYEMKFRTIFNYQQEKGKK